MVLQAAWTINGWNAPKVLLGSRQLRDSETMKVAGIGEGTVLHPVYDSSAYALAVVDPDFYAEMVPLQAAWL